MVWSKQKPLLWSWLQSKLGLIPIVLVWLGVVVTNYQPNTWFLSWDMLTSSFNPLQSLSRGFFGVWQDFQGLGVLGGHGYNASIPEALVQLVVSLFLPQSLLRYALAFLLLLVGAIGAYLLMTERVLSLFKLSKLQVNVLGSVVGLLYLLNLATVQTFYVGLEPFMWAYGVFPWVLWQLFAALETPNWKNYLGFLSLNVLLSVVGLIPPVFIAYGFFLVVILGTWWWQHRNKTRFWISVRLMSLVFVANLYWLIPVGMFAAFHSSEYLNSQLNQLSTQEFIYRSQYYGQLDKAAVFESFYFDSLDQDRFGQGGYSSIMLPWQQWLQTPGVKWIDYGFVIGAAVGWLLMLRYLRRNKKPVWSLGILGILSFAILANGTPILAELSYPLRSLPILNQAFRLPFSKISMFVSLFVAMGWGVLLLGMWQWLAPRLKIFGKIIWWLMAATVISAAAYATWPVFQGNFLYAGARVVLPKEYSEFITIFKQKVSPQARVALLPIFTYTGWDMHNWGQKQGYTGSGFWWYAIPQKLLHRSFDVWSSTNEIYRTELQTAIYDGDLAAIKALLIKYQVSYVLVDSSIYLPEKPNEAQQLAATKQLIGSNPDFVLVAQSGSLTLFQFKLVGENSAVFAPPFYSVAQALPERARLDLQFRNLGFTKNSPERIFPFDQLTLPKTSTVELGEVLKITAPELANQNYQALVLPQLTNELVRFNVIVRREANEYWLQLQPILPVFVFKTSATSLLDVTETVLPFNTIPTNPQLKLNDQTFDLSSLASASGELQLLGGVTLRFNQPVIVAVADQKLDLTAQTWQPSQTILRAEKTDQAALATAYVPVQKYRWRPTENTLVNCSFGKAGQIQRTMIGDSVEYQAENRGAACDYLNMSELSLDVGLLLHVKGENLSGQPVKLYVRNLATDKTELEYLLPKGKYDEVLSILPVTKTTQGLSLIFETRSFGTEVAKNRIDVAELYTVPMKVLLSTAVQTTQNLVPQKQNSTVSGAQQLGSGLHWFTVSAEQAGLVFLSTSYDQLWFALDLTHGRFLPHLQLNNWENAWEVSAGSSKVVLVYLPQLLVWIAFWVLLLVWGFVWKKARKSETQHPHAIVSRQLRNRLLGKR